MLVHVFARDLPKPPDIDVTLEVTLEDVYCARIKKIGVVVVMPDGESRRDLFVCVGDARPTYRFVGHGDCWCPRGWFGDILVRLVIKEHALFYRDLLDENDLVTTVRVPFLDYLYGGTYTVTHLDGESINIPYHAQAENTFIHVAERGLLTPPDLVSRGRLTVFFEVVLPTVPIAKLRNPMIVATLRRLFGPVEFCL